MVLQKTQSGQNITQKLKKSNKIGDNTTNYASECLEIGVIISSEARMLNYVDFLLNYIKKFHLFFHYFQKYWRPGFLLDPSTFNIRGQTSIKLNFPPKKSIIFIIINQKMGCYCHKRTHYVVGSAWTIIKQRFLKI